MVLGQRAAAAMMLIRSAKLNGHEPHAYRKDVMTRLPTHKTRCMGDWCRIGGRALPPEPQP
jgi:transposase